MFSGKKWSKSFMLNFIRDGRKHWFHGYVGSQEQAFNPPLATPMNQSYYLKIYYSIYIKCLKNLSKRWVCILIDNENHIIGEMDKNFFYH